MLFISGLSGIIIAICGLFPGGEDCWAAEMMHHAGWHGFTHHDTIFPLFLFIAGVSFPFSYAKQQANGMSLKKIYLKIVKRALILIFLGIVYNGLFKLDLAHIRIPSVLGRIGLAWMLAAIIHINFKPSARIVIITATLVGYWLLLRFVPAPDMPAGTDPFSKEGNLIGYIDRMIFPNHIYYRGLFDPEGLLSTIPAAITAMIGMLTGEFVRLPENSSLFGRNRGSKRHYRLTGSRKAAYMAIAAAGFLGIGLLWNIVFPINKMLWTSSFVCVVSAYSLGFFALFYYIIDVKQHVKWTLFFRVVGLNSITIYMAQKIVDFNAIQQFFLGGLASLCPEQVGALISSTGYLAACWLFVWFLYKKNIFLKI